MKLEHFNPCTYNINRTNIPHAKSFEFKFDILFSRWKCNDSEIPICCYKLYSSLNVPPLSTVISISNIPPARCCHAWIISGKPRDSGNFPFLALAPSTIHNRISQIKSNLESFKAFAMTETQNEIENVFISFDFCRRHVEVYLKFSHSFDLLPNVRLHVRVICGLRNCKICRWWHANGKYYDLAN